MKRNRIISALAIMLVALSTLTARSQTVGAPVEGTVTQEGQPLAGVQMIFTNTDTGKVIKDKTDKSGKFSIIGVPYGNYEIQVVSASGEKLFKQTTSIFPGATSEVPKITIDITKISQPADLSSAVAAMSADKAPPKLTKEELAKIKAANEKIAGLNNLISQAQTAMQAQNWPAAEAALKQLIAAAPDTNRWEFYKALGDAQKNSREFQDAVKTYAKGIEVGQALVSGSVPPDPKNPNSTPAAAKSGVGRMLTSQGNVYLSLENADEAVASFKKAAEIDPNPAIAYYNLCAVAFNAGKYTDAASACDKSIAADATKSEAWFFKGAALYKTGKMENGKQTVPPGTADALNKYLQIDPNGAHAGEVKTMFLAMGQK